MKKIAIVLALVALTLIVGSLDADISLAQLLIQECIGVLLACGAYCIAESEVA